MGLLALMAACTTEGVDEPLSDSATSALAGEHSLWDDTAVPVVKSDPDSTPVELGVRFRADVDGEITGIRYYKSRANTGAHTAHLWNRDGSLLASATFRRESTSGWQAVRFATPVSVKANTTYIASYHTDTGHYAGDNNYFTGKGVDRGPLHALADGQDGGNGVYRYGASGFPDKTYRGSNYWVDVYFKPASSPTTPDAGGAPDGSTPPPPPPDPPPPSNDGGFVVLGRSFPSKETTGVPAGTVLTPYTGPCTIQTNNVVIDAKIINCDMRILAQGITITRSVLNGHIYSDPDFFNGSFTMTDSEVRMPNSSGTGVGDVNFVLTRVEVTGGSRSVNCAANCTVQDSYLHGQYTDLRGIDHESAVRMGAGSIIRHNTIACDAEDVPPDAGCSAALTGYGDFAIVQKNTIDNNLIVAGSGGYCAYGGSTQGKPYSAGVNNIKFTNNVWQKGKTGKCGWYGPITSFDSKAPGNVWTNNLWDDGTAVPPSN